MEDWMYGLIAIPVVAAGAGYMYSRSSSKPPEPQRAESFQGDIDPDDPGSQANIPSSLYQGYQANAGRKRKTKKSKSKSKKTKRRR